MKQSQVYRRAGMISTFLVGLLVGTIALGGTAYAPPGAAPVHVVDAEDTDQVARVDTSGALKVAGQMSIVGTPSVNVANTPLPVSGEVSIANLPSSQDVNVTGGALGPVTQVHGITYNVEDGEEETESFSTINVTSITISTAGPGGADEVRMHYLTPLAGGLHPLMADDDGEQRTWVFTFSYPVPMNGIHFLCVNESFNCGGLITLAGF